jgi:hypothetical protein
LPLRRISDGNQAHLLIEDLVAAIQQVTIPFAPRPGANMVRLQPQRVRDTPGTAWSSRAALLAGRG